MKIANSILILVFSLCFACFSFAEDTRDDPPKPGFATHQVLFDAQKEYETGNFTEAEKILQAHLQENPEMAHYLIHFMLGNILAERGKAEQAVEQYKLSVKLYPEYADAWLNLGKLYYENGSYTLAAESFIRGFELGGQQKYSVKYQAAVCYLLSGDIPAALRLLEELSHVPNPEQTWIETLVSAYLENKQPQKALELIKQITGSIDNPGYLWKLRAQVMLELKNYQLALQSLLVYSYYVPLNATEQMLVGNLFNVVNSPSAAAPYYLASMEHGKDQLTSTNAERLAVTYLAAHETDKAVVSLQEAVQNKPDARLWLLLGKIFYDKGYFYDAGKAFAKSAEIDPLDGQAYLMQAYCLIKLEDLKGAHASLQAAVIFSEQQPTAEKLLDFVKGEME